MVQHADSPGTILIVTKNQPHASNWFGAPSAPVLPKDVAAALNTALCQGWSPTRSGSTFHLDQCEGFVAGPGTARG